MSRRCPECTRVNPAVAAFCYHDGVPLNGAARADADSNSINFGTLAFPTPFVFPDGQSCHNFLRFAIACQHNPPATLELLQQGQIEKFFAAMGRTDLAQLARWAARAPDRERGLDDLLAKLPGSPLESPVLKVEPTQHNGGIVQVGEERRFDLVLTNTKDRLLYGRAVIADCTWLGLGDAGASDKVFQFFDKATLPVVVLGKHLRAHALPQKAEIVLESNGGDISVSVQVLVPVKPFPDGVLSGALSPRQLAEKAKAQPKEAAVLIESGAVARWYEVNGWTYPVQGPTATGLAAVQQLFEVLGLVKTPKVEMSESAVTLRGKSGERLEYSLVALTREKRAAVAHGVSDQPWLTVGRPVFRGQTATLPLTVEEVSGEPGAALKACVKVTANGNQRFEVPVTLHVEEGVAARASQRSSKSAVKAPAPAPEPAPPPPKPAPEKEGRQRTRSRDNPLAPPREELAAEEVWAGIVGSAAPAPPAPAPEPEAAPEPARAPEPAPPVNAAPPPPPAPVALAPVAAVPAPTGVAMSDRRRMLLHLLPIAIVVVGLLILVGRDYFFRDIEPQTPEADYANPVLGLKFHDEVLPGDFVPRQNMTFGLGIPDSTNPRKFRTRLVYDELGRTCNVCVRIGGPLTASYLWGVQNGAWEPPIRQDLGKDRAGNRLIGAKAVWKRTVAPFITMTQYVEIVPGGLSPDGKKRLLDTCLVRYDLTNHDSSTHLVGLRFMLDTYIGANDGVPFTIAGAKELCDTMKDFKRPEEVPDFISALEKQDLKDPGTVAHITLKYGEGLEPPTRVTLGAWPTPTLRKLDPAQYPTAHTADKQDTLWEVPVLPMALAKSEESPTGDSAVVLYWADKEVLPGKTRSVGFAYGLGSVAGQKGDGQLGMTAGGQLEGGKEFTLTAYVKNPAPGTDITLTLPRGLQLVGGKEKEPVPPIPPGATGSYSPVTWRVKALDKGGVFRPQVTLSSGATLRHRVLVRPKPRV